MCDAAFPSAPSQVSVWSPSLQKVKLTVFCVISVTISHEYNFTVFTGIMTDTVTSLSLVLLFLSLAPLFLTQLSHRWWR